MMDSYFAYRYRLSKSSRAGSGPSRLRMVRCPSLAAPSIADQPMKRSSPSSGSHPRVRVGSGPQAQVDASLVPCPDVVVADLRPGVDSLPTGGLGGYDRRTSEARQAAVDAERSRNPCLSRDHVFAIDDSCLQVV